MSANPRWKTPYRNRAHASAYRAGRAVAQRGGDRRAPYDATSQSSIYFRNAWLAGFDSVRA